MGTRLKHTEFRSYLPFCMAILSAIFLYPLMIHCQNKDPYTVVAYYYPWYGGTENPHWPQGVAHEPWIGYYYSGSRAVVKQQIELARRYGVDAFAVSWPGIDTPGEKRFKSGFLKAPNLSQIRFCILYETLLRLGERGASPPRFNFNDVEIRQKFISDLVYIAKEYFGNPSYFKIQDRPVINFYFAGGFYGEFPSALDEARQQIRTLGWNPYFVADSMFYGRNDLYITSQFDAATTYNVYATGLDREGIRTTGELALSLRPLFWNFQYQLRDLVVEGKKINVDFQPGVIPQFDARVRRSNPNSALLARSKEEVKQIFLVAREILDSKSGPKVVWVTSWNEWHEGTAIEPTISGGPKYPGGNYGYDFLEALSEVFGD
jgi:glycoprotein endo-alpha-1,2-mannosidase